MASFLKRLLSPHQVSLENRILALAEENKEFLMPLDLQHIRESIEQNEWGNAFEILCIQLFEYEASITLEAYSRIEELGKEIGIEGRIWKTLENLLKND